MLWFVSREAWLQALLASLVMYAATSLGAACVLFSKRMPKHLLTALNGGAAGIMLAASFFSLLLPAVETEGPLPAFLPATVGFFAGGGLLILCDVLFSRKATFRALGGGKNALLFLAVTVHNIPEGMAVGVAFAAAMGESGVLAAVLLAAGIALQNFPEGLCVAFPLRADGLSPARSFLFSQGSGAVEIPACVLGALAAGAIGGLMPWALAFSAGAMVTVVCAELLPECFSGNKAVASLGVVLGFCLMMALDVAFG